MPGASFVEGRGSCGSPVAWHCGRRQRTPRAPLLRQFSPAELIPCSSGLTNFTARAPTALSRHQFTSNTTPATTSLHPSSLPCTHTFIHPHYPSIISLSLLNCLCWFSSFMSFSPAHSFHLHLIGSFTTDPVYFTSQLTIFQTMLLSFIHLNFLTFYHALVSFHSFTIWKTLETSYSCVIHHREHQGCVNCAEVTLRVWGNAVQTNESVLKHLISTGADTSSQFADLGGLVAFPGLYHC